VAFAGVSAADGAALKPEIKSAGGCAATTLEAPRQVGWQGLLVREFSKPFAKALLTISPPCRCQGHSPRLTRLKPRRYHASQTRA